MSLNLITEDTPHRMSKYDLNLIFTAADDMHHYVYPLSFIKFEMQLTFVFLPLFDTNQAYSIYYDARYNIALGGSNIPCEKLYW